VEKATGKRGGSIKAYIPTEVNGYMALKRREYGALYLANVLIKTDFNNLSGYVALALVRSGLATYKECQIPEQLRRYLIGNP
jgi:hypothetical protein